MSVVCHRRRLQLRAPRHAPQPEHDGGVACAEELFAPALDNPQHPPKQQQQQQQLPQHLLEDQAAPPPRAGQTPPHQQLEPLTCAAELLDRLPAGTLQRLQQLPAGFRPCDLVRELQAALGPSLKVVQARPPPLRPRRRPRQQQPHPDEQPQARAWQVPLLSRQAPPWCFHAVARGADAAAASDESPLPPLPLLLMPLEAQSVSGASSHRGVALEFHLTLLQQLDGLGWGSVVALSQVPLCFHRSVSHPALLVS
jgi:hypothetical protein